jgi:hypothetical protein
MLGSSKDLLELWIVDMPVLPCISSSTILTKSYEFGVVSVYINPTSVCMTYYIYIYIYISILIFHSCMHPYRKFIFLRRNDSQCNQFPRRHKVHTLPSRSVSDIDSKQWRKWKSVFGPICWMCLVYLADRRHVSACIKSLLSCLKQIIPFYRKKCSESKEKWREKRNTYQWMDPSMSVIKKNLK